MLTMSTLRRIFAAIAAFSLMGSGAVHAAGDSDEPASSASTGTRYVFAISWQPAFCETRPSRAECREQTADRFDASHFSLHGLWAIKKSYCGAAAELKARDKKSNWTDLPEVALSADAAARLKVAMPGVASGFERHQWVRSGTCLGMPAEQYFTLSMSLLDRVNASPVQALFAANLGKSISETQVRQAFDTAFGTGAGDRVRMRCQKDGDRRIITGLTIGLSNGLAEAADGTNMQKLILAAGTTKFNCTEGVVDAAGVQ
ncbi:ribonuclease T2 family protein [Pararhizobium sp.]|uniref:ribonuclease T2 family protein n=1 Tax=Pararhizobium sp. TaxID=1977563 RepID=UPI003FA69D6F